MNKVELVAGASQGIGSAIAEELAEPTDIANAEMFLLSDQADYMNGAELTLDGGASLGARTF